MGVEVLLPRIELLLAAVALDLLLGDPVYSLHPIRLMGASLARFEKALWKLRLNGYFGGVLLFSLLAAFWMGVFAFGAMALDRLHPVAGQAFHVLSLYSMLALGDLLKHGRDVDQAVSQDNLAQARLAVAKLVGRDTDQMDGPACRRAAIESLAESLVDGFAGPLLFYSIGGLPAVVLFKVISTMDSMVGYQSQQYLRFGWCGARLDDLVNLAPARLAWLFIAAAAVALPRCSAAKALRIGWRQHAQIPGPNAGWSEAATAGALQRRLVGPIWSNSELVTELWIGDPADAQGGAAADYRNAARLVLFAAALFVATAIALI